MTVMAKLKNSDGERNSARLITRLINRVAGIKLSILGPIHILYTTLRYISNCLLYKNNLFPSNGGIIEFVDSIPSGSTIQNKGLTGNG